MHHCASPESRLQELARKCAESRHRRLVVLAGGPDWCLAQAQRAVAALPGEWCWIGAQGVEAEPVVAVDKAATLLGGEWHGIIYDTRAGFDPDAFGAIAGTVRAGGLLLLLTPPLAEWPGFPDPQRHRLAVYPFDEGQVGGRFLGRLAGLLREMAEAHLIEEGRPLPPLSATTVPPATVPGEFVECATADQLAAVEALCRVARGHRRRPLVLLSDRGRGKSAALGLAAARLLQQGARSIVVTAPRLSAVAAVFRHAALQLDTVESSPGLLRTVAGGELRFEPPDGLVHSPESCDLLLVDEAAAIPASLLEALLRGHARIAFASTVHGYEGTGRGFELRFFKVLETLTPQWHRLRLQQPIRWADGDPLEQAVFRTLLLDAEPPPDEAVAAIPVAAWQAERLPREQLLQDEALLSQLFGLLVLAHYRTSPGDLRNLLDGPNLSIMVLRHGELLAGCALVAEEGGFDAALSQQIYAGERRLRGNLLPQSLATHAGLAEAPRWRGVRIMRIAIHPACQGRGLGRRLLAGIAEQAAGRGLDYLGASFGADAPLLDFWLACGCLPVRAGLHREASSGAHSVMVMQPLSAQGENLFTEARRRLAQQLATLFAEPLAGLEPALAARLCTGCPLPFPEEMVWEDVASFAFAQRDYGNCLAALRQVLLYALADAPALLDGEEQGVAIGKVLQLRPWPELVAGFGLSGRKAAMDRLREIFRTLCRHYQSSH